MKVTGIRTVRVPAPMPASARQRPPIWADTGWRDCQPMLAPAFMARLPPSTGSITPVTMDAAELDGAAIMAPAGRSAWCEMSAVRRGIACSLSEHGRCSELAFLYGGNPDRQDG
jgi:hypothetical protein